MASVTNTVRVTVYEMECGRTELPSETGAVYFVYAKSGTGHIKCDGRSIALSTDEGAFATGEIIADNGSQLWVFEKSEIGAPFADLEIVASHVADLSFSGPHFVRADRIETEHSAETPRHFHKGPGLRRLVYGKLRADVGDTVFRIEQGDAWFETGDEPVVGTNYGGTNAAFVRLLVLPIELFDGKSSFVPTDAAEAAKPRSVDQRVFGEVSCSKAQETY